MIYFYLTKYTQSFLWWAFSYQVKFPISFGESLDNHGTGFGIERKPKEWDYYYRKRILDHCLNLPSEDILRRFKDHP